MNKSVYRLHVDDQGYVWYAFDGQMPVPSMTKVGDFMRNPPMGMADSTKAIGCPNNVDLLLRLYDRKLNGKLARVQVCTPAVCPTASRRKRPEVVLLDANQWQGWPASLGGWHEFGEDDFPAYYLARNFMVGLETMDVTKHVGRTHVAWHALSFIPHLNEEYSFRLLAMILDPRWFVDPEEPEKNSRLEGFLGLTPRTQYHVSGDGNNKTVQAYDRCATVLRAWKMGKPTSKAEYAQPGNFLWRIHANEGTGYKADLRTSQAFVSFLKNVWLHELYRGRGGAGCDGLFVPEYFFKHKNEAEAYRQHMRRHIPAPRQQA